VEDIKQSVKRWLHDNAVTVVTILLFVVILAILVATRYGSLLSIANISSINPLITTESAELVAVNVNGVIQIIKDDDGKVTEAEKKAAAKDKNSTTGNSNQGGGTTSGGGSTSGGSSGGSGGSSGGGGTASPSPSSSPSSSPSPSPSASPSPSPPPPPGPIMAAILSLERTHRDVNDEVYLPLLGWSCENDHTFRTTVKATSGSGSLKVRWRHGNAVKETQDLGTMSNGDARVDEYVLRDQTVGGSMTVEVIRSGGSNPVIDSKTINFNHSCS
jgi:hypothetical protein